ncbi:MAG: hydroxymethylbilane synthase [Pirellulales bacterium]
MKTIRIGTRGSKLALWQADWVTAQLRSHGYEVERIIITTTGDVAKQPLSQVGGMGLFTKEIQRELLADNVDVAVHSLKDLPTIPVDGLRLAAVPERETTDDVLISRNGETFEVLPSGARIGTGSLRRAAQLKNWRTDVEIHEIRGNVDSRLAKLTAGEFDAIVLAAAGLTRLGLADKITERFSSDRMLPAVGQGALGLECRVDDVDVIAALRQLNHTASEAEVTAERAMLKQLLAGCLAPVAARATVDDDRLFLSARVLSLDGTEMLAASAEGSLGNAESIGRELADHMLARGAAELIAASRRYA